MLVAINLQVQLYCIITGSCQPFATTSVRHYMYELERYCVVKDDSERWEEQGELLVICFVYMTYFTLWAIKCHFIVIILVLLDRFLDFCATEMVQTT